MKRRKRNGVILLIAGILVGAVGTGMLVYGVISFLETFKPLAVLASPGEVQVEINEPGIYTLWHDHDTFHKGVAVSHIPALPSGFDYVLVRDSDQARLSMAPSRAHTTLSTGSRESVGVGTFEPTRAGTYTLQIKNPAGDNRTFSLTKGSFLSGIANFGLWVVLGGLVILVGLVLLVLGIIFMVMVPKPPPGPQTPPPSGPA